MSGVLLVRPLVAEDAPALLQMAHRQDRNVHAREFERFLSLEGATGLVVQREEAMLGAITAIRYFEHGFLGPPIVERGPDAVGVSLLLLGRALEGLLRSGAAYVECEASPEHAALLRPMGFSTLRRTLVLEREPAPAKPALATVPCEMEHLLDIGIVDADIAGYGRKGYLDALRLDHPDAARVLLRDEEVAGYVFARRSRNGYHLGPLATRSPGPAHARDLLADAVAALATWPITALVPEGSPLLPDLHAHGFAQVASLERMRAGAAPDKPGTEATEWIGGGRITG